MGDLELYLIFGIEGDGVKTVAIVYYVAHVGSDVLQKFAPSIRVVSIKWPNFVPRSTF
jgi:hypothetical protein